MLILTVDSQLYLQKATKKGDENSHHSHAHSCETDGVVHLSVLAPTKSGIFMAAVADMGRVIEAWLRLSLWLAKLWSYLLMLLEQIFYGGKTRVLGKRMLSSILVFQVLVLSNALGKGSIRRNFDVAAETVKKTAFKITRISPASRSNGPARTGVFFGL